MRVLAVLALSLFATAARPGPFLTESTAPEKLRPLLVISAQTYNEGQWCRNAAANVAVAATVEDLPVRIPTFWTNDTKTEGHVFPLVYFQGGWWAIDAVYSEKKREHFARCKLIGDYDPGAQLKELSEFSDRPLLTYNGDATNARIELWFDEKQRFEELGQALKDLRKKVEIGERALKILSKEFPELWGAYQDSVARHRANQTR